MSELPISGSYRPTIMGTHGMVASGHYLRLAGRSAHPGSGGNAVDAGVAAGLCTACSRSTWWTWPGSRRSLSTRRGGPCRDHQRPGRWPQAASVAYFQKHHGGRIPHRRRAVHHAGRPRRLDHGA